MRASLSTRTASPRHPSALALLTSIVLITTRTTTLVSAQASDATCFWPDGSATGENYLPCGSGATPHSTCCSRGWACLSNGLCMAAGQDPSNLGAATIVQGGCTDRTWNTGDCPSWCTNEDDLEKVLNRAQPIRQCPRSGDRFYCELAEDNADCEDTDEYFTFAGSLTVVTTVGVTETTPTSSESSTSSTASGSGASSIPPDEITTGTEPASSETSGTTDPGNGSSSDTGPDALAIGLGVGIGVGGLGIILAVVFFILWRRRGRKAKAAAAAAAAAGGDVEDGDGGEKGAAAIGMASSPESGLSELPTTVSKNVHEASPDAMIAEAPEGDQTIGRVEAPLNERRFEVETAEGTQGRHELAGSEVPPRETLPVSPAGGGSSGDLSPLGASTMDASTLGVSAADDVSPVTPTNITRKPVA